MSLRKNLVRTAATTAALALATVSTSALAATFIVDLEPLNGSGVTGTATLTLSDDRTQLTVAITATGLTPDMNHPGHIHGLFTPSGQPKNSTSPTLAQDTDGDGFIEVAEGAATYGPIILPLAGLVDAGPEAPGGVLTYSETFNLLDNSIYAGMFSRDDLLPLQLREIVLHGMFVPPGPGAGTPGEVDGTNGYLAVLPVASGQIRPAAEVGAVPEPGTWAMMLFGFGAVGFGMRRRNKDKVRVRYSF